MEGSAASQPKKRSLELTKIKAEVTPLGRVNIELAQTDIHAPEHGTGTWSVAMLAVGSSVSILTGSMAAIVVADLIGRLSLSVFGRRSFAIHGNGSRARRDARFNARMR